MLAIQLTGGAFIGPVRQQTGFFFYLEQVSAGLLEDGAIITRPEVTGYEYRRGKIVDEFVGNSAEFLRELDAIGFEAFNYQEEIESVTKIQGEEAISPPMVLDGGEYEIRFSYRESRFTMRTWEPGPAIDYFAPSSPKIAKLKALIDLAARYVGRSQFGV